MNEPLHHTLIRIAGSAHALLNQLERDGILTGPITERCIEGMMRRVTALREAFRQMNDTTQPGETTCEK